VEDLVVETKGDQERQLGQVGSPQSSKHEILSENEDAIAEIGDAASQILQVITSAPSDFLLGFKFIKS